MNLNQYKKIYYIFLSIFLIFLNISYQNIAKGGSITFYNYNLFYIFITIASLLLIYFLINSKKIENLDLIIVFLYCMSLSLIFIISVGKFPFGLDSIISVHSVEFIYKYGFSSHIVNQNNLISATYSLPGLSILALELKLILNSSYLIICKNLAIIVTSIFFLLYYIFITELFEKRSALISLILIYSFYQIITLGSQFANVIIAFCFIILLFYLLIKKDNNHINLVLIQILVLIAFVISHHLTFLIFLLMIILIYFYYLFIEKKSELLIKTNPMNFILFVGIIMIAYNIYIYFGPLELIFNSLTGNLISEGTAVSAPQSWNFQIVLQRIMWVLFLVFSTILIIYEAKIIGIKNFIKQKYFIFIFLGLSIFIISIITILLHVPFEWDRINIFGWLILIPAVTFIVNSKSIKIKNIYMIVITLLFFGNILLVPQSVLDHSNNNEYSGDFKNWIKEQEYTSLIWLNNYNYNNNNVIGDEVVNRIYKSNSLNFNGNSSIINIQNKLIKNENFKYIVLRKENFFNIIGGYSKNPWETSNGLSNFTIININNNSNLIYNNEEVSIFET